MANGEAERVAHALDNLSDRMVDMQAAISTDAERTALVVRTAVAEGIRDVLKDKGAVDLFWSAAYEQLHQSAAKNTGRFVLGSLRALMVRGGTLLLLGMLIYNLGGWTAVAKLWQTIFPPH